MKKACCYYCKWWDGNNASNSWVDKGSMIYAFCLNPIKCRPDTGYEACPSLAIDFCMEFEPIEGWTNEWKRIMKRYEGV